MNAERMPSPSQRAHTEPPSHGDVLPAIRRLGRLAKGPDHVRGADRNAQVVWKNPRRKIRGGFEIRLMHWGQHAADWNDFHYFLEPGATRARHMTKAELRRGIGRWADADVARWRRSPDPHSDYPPTYREAAKLAMHVGARIFLEMKSNAFARAVVGQYFVDEAHAAGHPPWAMALAGSMKFCRQKCHAVETAVDVDGNHGQFMPIFGRSSLRRRWRPVYLRLIKTWRPRPTAIG